MEVKYYLEVKEVKDVCSNRENINLRSEKTISLTSLTSDNKYFRFELQCNGSLESENHHLSERVLTFF